MRSRAVVVFAAMCAIGLCNVVTFAQNAEVSGRITDPNGLPVPKVKVEAINVLTNAVSSVETNDVGLYTFASLPPAVYRVLVEKEGFDVIVKPSVELHIEDHIVLNFALRVGSLSTSVTVEGGAPLINTESSAVGTVVDRQFVANMPLNGRSFQSLIDLIPGVVVASSNGNNPGQFSVNGQRSDANYFTIDGVSANSGINPGGSIGVGGAGAVPPVAASGGFNNLVSMDALQEFQIQTSTFAPEFGRTPGGQVSIVTRSGANQFHGDVFDYVRNNDFDAKDWFTKYTGAPQTPLHQNDFGGVVGGPILKDKLFFFASYEGLRLHESIPGIGAVPSLCSRGTAPANGPQSCAATGGVVGPAAILPYLQAYPDPTPGAPFVDANAQNFFTSLPNKVILDAGSIRIDYNINNSMRLFGRYNNAPSSTVSLGISGTQSSIQIPTTTITLGYSWNISSTVLNDARFNYTTVSAPVKNTMTNFHGAVPLTTALLYPVPGETAANLAGFSFNPNGVDSIRDIQQEYSGNNSQKQINFVDSVSVTKGAHQLKFGFDWRRLTPTFTAPFGLNLQLSTEEQMFQTAQLDQIAAVSQPGQTDLFQNYSSYIQDTWKVTPRLTLTYGLRWDINPPPGSPNGTYSFAFSSFDPAAPGAATLAPFGTPLYKTSWNALGPRVGVAYQLSANPRWQRVVRGGFGIFYDTADDASALAFGPYTSQNLHNSSTTGGTVYSLPLSQYTGGCPSGSVAPAQADACPLNPIVVSKAPPFTAHQQLVDPHLQLPITYNFSLAVEQSLGTNQTIAATYIGSLGRSLIRTKNYLSSVDFTSFFPRGYRLFVNGGTSDYDALQVQYHRRISHGLQVLGSWTWAHAIDTSSQFSQGFLFLYGSASDNPVRDRASSSFDVRHAIHAAVSYSLPTPSESHVFVRSVFGHWAIDGIEQFNTAPPFDLIASPFFSPSGVQIISRPNLVPGQPIWLHGNVCPLGLCPGGRRVNPAAFTNPSGGVQGDFPRNALRGFDLQQTDITLRREFPIRERFNLQFRADFFNTFNHPNFAAPANFPANFLPSGANAFGISQSSVANASASQLGSVATSAYNPAYSTGGPREIQLSLKLLF